jgi:hypothetical protein
MNHWLDEKLAWLVVAERQQKLENRRLLNTFGAMRDNWAFTTPLALKLSDWLIATGERLRMRYEKTAPVSTWLGNGKFAR